MLSGAACQGDLFSSTPVVATIENSPIPLVVALTHAPAPTATESIHPPVVEVENPTATPSKPPTPTPTATSSPMPTMTPTSPALYGSSEKEHYWFARPIAQFEMNWTDKYYPYGSTRNGTLRPHHGVEFIVPMKTAVLAAADGVVVVAGDDSAEAYGAQTNFYGNLVVIKHDFEYENWAICTLYAHLSQIKVKVGDILYFNTWGGGGWGDPLARSPELVALDVRRGLVSRDGAKRYGVVIADSGAVDTSATERLRQSLATERGEITEIFNFGGTIEEIKSRCLVETHLPAPETPVFRNKAR